MPKTSAEPAYSQVHERLEGLEVVRDWLNISSGRCNIQIGRDLKGLVRELQIVANKIASQVGAHNVDVRGIDRRLGIIDERFNGIIHLLGSTIGVSQDELNKILLKFEKLNKGNINPEKLSFEKMIEEMDELKPENHHRKSSFQGEINYSLVFKNCLNAYLHYKQFEVLLPEHTSTLFRPDGKNPLTPGENFIMGFGSAALPLIRQCMKGINIKSSSNLKKLEDLTESLKVKLLNAKKD